MGLPNWEGRIGNGGVGEGAVDAGRGFQHKG